MSIHPDDMWTEEDEERLLQDQIDARTYIQGRDAVALDAANVHMKRIAFWEGRIAEVQAVADASIERARAWLLAETARLRQHADWHRDAVTGLHEALLDEDPKRKTIHLPHGTMKARKLPDRIEADPEVTLPWLIDHRPHLLRHEIDKPSLNRAVKAGDEIPGVAVTPGEVRFSVDTQIDSEDAA